MYWSIAILLFLPFLTGCPARPTSRVYVAQPPVVQDAAPQPAWVASLAGIGALLVPALTETPAISSFRGWPRIGVLPVENRSHMILDPVHATARLSEVLAAGGGTSLVFVGGDASVSFGVARNRLWSGTASEADFQLLRTVDWLLLAEVQDPLLLDPTTAGDFMVIRFQLFDSDTAVIAWTRSFKWNKED